MIAAELEKVDKKSYQVVEDGQLVLVTNVETQMVYSVTFDPDSPSCSCALPKTCGVPCRHMFAILKARGNDCFRPDLVASRWRLCRVADDSSSLPAATVLPLQEARVQQSSFPVAAGSHLSRFNSAMVVMKEIDHLVAHQLTAYLKTSNLLPALQSAFRNNHFIETSATEVLSDILLTIDSGEVAMFAMLELFAAFDTVDHTVLIKRLERSFDIAGSALAWIESYLRQDTVHPSHWREIHQQLCC